MTSGRSRTNEPVVLGREAFVRSFLAAEGGRYAEALTLLEPVIADPAAHSWEAAYLAAWLILLPLEAKYEQLDEDEPGDMDGIGDEADDDLFNEFAGLEFSDDEEDAAFESIDDFATAAFESSSRPATLDALALETAATLLEHAVASSPPVARWPRELLARVRDEQGDHVAVACHRLFLQASAAESTTALVACIEHLGRSLRHLATLDADSLQRGVESLVAAVRGSALPDPLVSEVEAEIQLAGAQRLAVLGRFDDAEKLLEKAETAQPENPALQRLGHRQRPDDLPSPAQRLAGLEIEGSLVQRVFGILHIMTSTEDVRASNNDRPSALLLFGPSGTGKTHIVRAFASRQRSGFVYRKARMDQLFGRYVGESEKALSALLRDVVGAPNGGLAFLDELDALGSERDTGAEAWRAGLVGHFLAEMDHFKEQTNGAAIVGGTNRIWALDHAVLRRFDEIVLTPLPTDAERRDLFATLFLGAGVELPVDALEEIVSVSNSTTPADCATAFNNVHARHPDSTIPDMIEHLCHALEKRRAGNHLARWIAHSRAKLASDGFEHLLEEFDRHYGSNRLEGARVSPRRSTSFPTMGSRHLRFLGTRVR